MSFSCTIKAGKKDLTKFEKGPIHRQLLGLGPDGPSDTTDAPYRVSHFRDVVARAAYADRLPEAAQDCFRELQIMAKANIDAMKEYPHCDTCKCELKIKDTGIWWNIENCQVLLDIDPKTITYIDCSY